MDGPPHEVPLDLPPPPPPLAPPSGDRGGTRARRRLAWGALLAGVVLLIGSVAFATLGRGPSAGARTLALSFTPGERQTYRIHVSTEGSVEAGELLPQTPMSDDLTEIVSWHVVAVDDEGVATIRVSVDLAFGSVNGRNVPMDASDFPMVEIRVAPDGRTLASDGLPLAGLEELTGGPLLPGTDQLTPLLPDHPVEPGDEWDASFSSQLPFGRGSVRYEGTSRFLRYERITDTRAALIRTELTGRMDLALALDELLAAMAGMENAPEGSELAGIEATFRGGFSVTQHSWVDAEDGDLLRASSTTPFDLSASIEGLDDLQGLTFTFEGRSTMEIERVSSSIG